MAKGLRCPRKPFYPLVRFCNQRGIEMIYENEWFKYDSETGYLYRNKDSICGNGTTHIKKGDLCSLTPSKSTGYLRASFGGKRRSQHRIAWWVTHGRWPTYIDHINHIRTDNRLCNLRNVLNHGTQCHNVKKHCDNASGCTGVRWRADRKRWKAEIFVYGKAIYLGLFKNLEDAIAARKVANAKYGFHENHGKE